MSTGTFDRNSNLPQAVRDLLNRRGQGAWRLTYNEAIRKGLCASNAKRKAWRAVNRRRGCTSCGSGENFFR